MQPPYFLRLLYLRQYIFSLEYKDGSAEENNNMYG